MAKYLIDTDILITVLRTGRNLDDLIGRTLAEQDILAISVITIAELYAGASAQEPQGQNRIDELCSAFLIIPINADLAKRAGGIKFSSGIPLDDALIAASALATNSVLITQNIKHFQEVQGLNLLSPWFFIMEKALGELGLSPKEIKLYLALLQLGEETVFELSKKAQVKRTTAYSILEGLKEKGIVSRRQAKKAALYSAVEPEQLLKVYQERVEGFKEVLPQLKALKKDSSKGPKVQVFEGREPVKNVYYEVVETLKKGPRSFVFCYFWACLPCLRAKLRRI